MLARRHRSRGTDGGAPAARARGLGWLARPVPASVRRRWCSEERRLCRVARPAVASRCLRGGARRRLSVGSWVPVHRLRGGGSPSPVRQSGFGAPEGAFRPGGPVGWSRRSSEERWRGPAAPPRRSGRCCIAMVSFVPKTTSPPDRSPASASQAPVCDFRAEALGRSPMSLSASPKPEPRRPGPGQRPFGGRSRACRHRGGGGLGAAGAPPRSEDLRFAPAAMPAPEGLGGWARSCGCGASPRRREQPLSRCPEGRAVERRAMLSQGFLHFKERSEKQPRP